MNISILIVIITIILVSVFVWYLFTIAEESRIIVRSSTCQELNDSIKENMDEIPPRSDMKVRQWIAKECWK